MAKIHHHLLIFVSVMVGHQMVGLLTCHHPTYGTVKNAMNVWILLILNYT